METPPPRASRQPLRSHLPLAPEESPLFRWRGTGVSRLEGLADAVFAFTVTLLVVALEVPRDFDGLMQVMEGFPAFAATFALLMWYWSVHYTFFRRYGLEGPWIRFLNIVALLLIVFLAYPLKFLISAAFASFFGLGVSVFTLNSLSELSQLYILYGLGLGSTWFVYWLMFYEAYRQRKRLQLTPVEVLLTRGSMAEISAIIAVCMASVLLAMFNRYNWQTGMIYMLLGPLMAFIGWHYGSRAEKLHRQAQKQKSTGEEPTPDDTAAATEPDTAPPDSKE
ncbi:MAG: hypothetical protein SynsKO_03650 [Synoicihabitans sp.]